MNELHLYWLPTPAGEAALSTPLLRLLDRDEHARHARLVREEDRHLYRAAHALTRLALSRHQAAVAPDAWRFRADAHGRPEIVAPASSLRFNLSHTAGLVTCAVGGGCEFGVDVEETTRSMEICDLAASVFAPAEREALAGAPQREVGGLFFELWTLREAYLKALGLGFSTGLGTFSIMPRPRPPRLRTSGDPVEDARWSFYQAAPTPTHQLALAVRTAGEPVPLQLHPVALRSLLVTPGALG